MAGKNQRLTVVADGGATIGMGHLTRMATLVQRLGCEVSILTTTGVQVEQIFKSTQDNIVLLKSFASDELVKAAMSTAGPGGVVVLDPPYYFDQKNSASGSQFLDVVKRLREYGIRVVRFTDEASPTRHGVDLLVNDHPLAQKFVSHYGESKVLAGPSYFLFDAAHDAKTCRSEKEPLALISFGGADQMGLYFRFADAINELARTWKIRLAVGGDTPIPESLGDGVEVTRGANTRQFAAMMQEATVAITASGNTLYERIVQKCPGLSLAQSLHQETIGREFDALGVTKHLGMGSTVSSELFYESAKQFLSDEAGQLRQSKACEAIDVRAGCAEIVHAVGSLFAGGCA